MAMWKTEQIGVYYDKDKCHMTDRWPFKWWKLAHHLMYILEVY